MPAAPVEIVFTPNLSELRSAWERFVSEAEGRKVNVQFTGAAVQGGQGATFANPAAGPPLTGAAVAQATAFPPQAAPSGGLSGEARQAYAELRSRPSTAVQELKDLTKFRELYESRDQGKREQFLQELTAQSRAIAPVVDVPTPSLSTPTEQLRRTRRVSRRAEAPAEVDQGAIQQRLSERYEQRYEARQVADRVRADREVESEEAEFNRNLQRLGDQERRAGERIARANTRDARRLAKPAEDGRDPFGLSGFGRIIGLGTVVRSVENAYAANIGYQRDLALAGADPQAQLTADFAFRDRLASIPFAGQLAEFIQDPAGTQRTAVEVTLRRAQQQDQQTAAIAQSRAFHLNFARQVATAQLVPVDRQRQQIEQNRLDRVQQIQEQANKDAEEIANTQKQLTDLEGSEGRQRYSPENLEKQIAITRAERQRLIRQAEARRTTDLRSTGSLYRTELENFAITQRNALDLTAVEGGTARVALSQGSDAAALYRLREQNRIARRNPALDESTRQELLVSHFAAEDYAEDQFRRGRFSRAEALRGSTQALGFQAQNRPFEAGLAQLTAAGNIAYSQAEPAERYGVALNNVAKIVAYGADFARRIQSINRENYGAAEVGRLLLSGDERGAALARVRQQRDEELANAPQGIAGALIRGGINARYDTQERLVNRDISTNIFARQQGLRDQLAAATLEAQGREKSAQAEAIYSSAQRQAEIFRRQNLNTEADLAEQTGRQSLLAYRRELVRGSGAALNFEPGTLGPGYDLSTLARYRESPQSAIDYIDEKLRPKPLPRVDTGEDYQPPVISPGPLQPLPPGGIDLTPTRNIDLTPIGGGRDEEEGVADNSITKEQGEAMKSLLQQILDVFR
jgi:hypothetical protein